MTTPTYTPTDIVNFAMNKDAVNISSAFDQLVGQRVYDAIQARKIEVARSMFGQEEIDIEVEDDENVEDGTNVETVAVGDETNTESEESHENAEQSA
jgi:hypothetical protein